MSLHGLRVVNFSKSLLSNVCSNISSKRGDLGNLDDIKPSYPVNPKRSSNIKSIVPKQHLRRCKNRSPACVLKKKMSKKCFRRKSNGKGSNDFGENKSIPSPSNCTEDLLYKKRRPVRKISSRNSDTSSCPDIFDYYRPQYIDPFLRYPTRVKDDTFLNKFQQKSDRRKRCENDHTKLRTREIQKPCHSNSSNPDHNKLFRFPRKRQKVNNTILDNEELKAKINNIMNNCYEEQQSGAIPTAAGDVSRSISGIPIASTSCKKSKDDLYCSGYNMYDIKRSKKMHAPKNCKTMLKYIMISIIALVWSPLVIVAAFGWFLANPLKRHNDVCNDTNTKSQEGCLPNSGSRLCQAFSCGVKSICTKTACAFNSLAIKKKRCREESLKKKSRRSACQSKVVQCCKPSTKKRQEECTSKEPFQCFQKAFQVFCNGFLRANYCKTPRQNCTSPSQTTKNCSGCRSSKKKKLHCKPCLQKKTKSVTYECSPLTPPSIRKLCSGLGCSSSKKFGCGSSGSSKNNCSSTRCIQTPKKCGIRLRCKKNQSGRNCCCKNVSCCPPKCCRSTSTGKPKCKKTCVVTEKVTSRVSVQCEPRRKQKFKMKCQNENKKSCSEMFKEMFCNNCSIPKNHDDDDFVVSNCHDIYLYTLNKRPCFWIYEKYPNCYPTFLRCHRSLRFCFNQCMMGLAFCCVSPFMFCCYSLYCCCLQCCK